MPLPMHKEEKSPTIRFVIAVAAGKGGVGKSTVSVHLAEALKRKGHSVGLLDTDLYGPSIRRMLPEDRLPRQEGDRIIPALSRGIKLLSIAYFRKENEAVAVRAPIANRLITQFLQQVDWGPLDFLIIDFPPGTGDIQMSLSQQAVLSGALLVTTPQEVAIMDVRKAAHLFTQLHVPILGIVENMSYFQPEQGPPIAIFGEGGGLRLADELAVPLLGSLPLDPKIAAQGDLGLALEPGSLSEKIVDQLADRLQEQLKAPGSRSPIREVRQKDSRTLELVWSDGRVSAYRLSDLQKQCPCAACVDGQAVDEEVSARQVSLVGRYALRIDYTSGCSKGIYPFDFLRDLAEVLI